MLLPAFLAICHLSPWSACKYGKQAVLTSAGGLPRDGSAHAGQGDQAADEEEGGEGGCRGLVAMQKGYEMPKTPLRMETLESEDEAPPLPPRAPTSKKVSILHIPGPIACGCQGQRQVPLYCLVP